MTKQLVIGKKYNWINQPERLVYIGKNGCWHQFAKIDSMKTVWCEVLDHDLTSMEETFAEKGINKDG